MSDYGPGNTVPAEPIDPGSDNLDELGFRVIPITNVVEMHNAIADAVGEREYHRGQGGRFAPIPDPVGMSLSAGLLPEISTETTNVSDNFDPTNAKQVSGMFSWLSNQIVQASVLAEQFASLSRSFEDLQARVDAYVARISRQDEEIEHLRAERVDLQRENGMLRQEVDSQTVRAVAAETKVEQMRGDLDRVNDLNTTYYREKSDAENRAIKAELEVLDLQDTIKQLTTQRDIWQSEASQSRERLAKIKAEADYQTSSVTQSAA